MLAYNLLFGQLGACCSASQKPPQATTLLAGPATECAPCSTVYIEQTCLIWLAVWCQGTCYQNEMLVIRKVNYCICQYYGLQVKATVRPSWCHFTEQTIGIQLPHKYKLSLILCLTLQLISAIDSHFVPVAMVPGFHIVLTVSLSYSPHFCGISKPVGVSEKLYLSY